MKKSLIALAVLGAIAGAAQAQSSVTIYGIVDTGVTFSNNVKTATGSGTKTSLNSGVIQGSRLGFKGTEDLGSGLKAVFQLESGFKNDTGAQGVAGTLFDRTSVVGLSGDFGTVLLGRQTDILHQAGDFTSVLDFGTIVNSPHAFDRLEGTRTQNSIRYNSPNLSGFTGSAIYGFGEQAGKTSAGQSFGLGGIYANGPIGAYAAYYQSKAGKTPSDILLGSGLGASLNASLADGTTALKTFSTGVSYKAGPARVYGNWSLVKAPNLLPSAIKQNVFEIGTDYALTAPLHLLASVQHARVSLDNSAAPKSKLTQINLGSDYWLSKRTDVYAFVSHQRTKDNYPLTEGVWSADAPKVGSDGSANQTSVSVGIRHKF